MEEKDDSQILSCFVFVRLIFANPKSDPSTVALVECPIPSYLRLLYIRECVIALLATWFEMGDWAMQARIGVSINYQNSLF